MVDGFLAYRYIPAVGRPGEADAKYAVKQPAAKAPGQEINLYKEAPEASLEIVESTFEQLPTLHNIVNALARLPNHGVVESGIYDLQETSDCGRVSKIDVKRMLEVWTARSLYLPFLSRYFHSSFLSRNSLFATSYRSVVLGVHLATSNMYLGLVASERLVRICPLEEGPCRREERDMHGTYSSSDRM